MSDGIQICPVTFRYPAEKGLVSVVIPVFRRADYLQQALASVLAQTYSSVEILVVDDASGDEFVSQYQIPPQARLLQLPINGGPSAARNLGCTEARGEFIAFLDSDDAWMPQKLARQVADLTSQPESGLTYCHFEEVDSEMRSLGTHPRVKWPHPDSLTACLRSPTIKSPSTVLLRRKALEAAGGFDLSLRYGEDRDLWLRIALEHRFEASPEPMVLYRVHEDQLTSPQHRLKNARSEVLFAETWSTRLASSSYGIQRITRQSVSSAYRGLAKALFECEGNRSGALEALRKARQANPWDHRVLFKIIQYTLGYGTSR